MVAIEVETGSPEETETLAGRLATRLAPGDVVLVSGELGAGKTTFVRGACRALGVTARVTSPTFTIGHRYAGSPAIDLGSLVTIEQLDPMGIDFRPSSRYLEQVSELLKGGLTCTIYAQGELDREFPYPGTLIFIDNQVDKQTGSLTVKLVSDNTEEVLWPGLSVEVALTVEVKPGMLSAPASAVLPAQQGMITWVIDGDNKVAPRVVTVERIVGQTVFINAGVKAGERVVTDGQLRLAPGATVTIEEPRRPSKPGEERRNTGRG